MIRLVLNRRIGSVLFLLPLLIAPGCGKGGGSGNNVPFRVDQILPADGSIDVSVNTAIEIQFSRAVSQASVQNGVSFSLVETSQPGLPIQGAFSYDPTGRVLTFTPQMPLGMTTDHTLTLSAGIQDGSGTPLVLSRSQVPLPSTFRTEFVPDTTEPLFGGATAAIALTDTSIELRWTAATDDRDPQSAIIYNVYMATGPGAQNFGVPDATTAPSAVLHLMGGLQPLTTYFFVVRAEDTSGNEEANAVEVSATTLATPDTMAPLFGGVTTAMELSETSIDLSWTEAMDDTDPQSAIVYNIYMALSPGGQNFGVPDDTSLPGVASHIVSGLQSFTTYYFVVRSQDTSGNEDTNVIEEFATTLSPQDTMAPLFGGATGATEISNTAIEVTWMDAVDDIDPASAIVYNVYVAQISGMQNFALPDATTLPGANLHVIGSLSPGTTYFIVVRAEDTSGNEDMNTMEVFATTTAVGDVIDPIFLGLVSATAVSPTEIELMWNAATDNVAPPSQIIYNIYFATVAGMQNFAVPDATTAPGVVTQLITGLTEDTDYYFVVRAEDPSGNEESNVVEVLERSSVSFFLQVQPLFSSNCTGCHGPPSPTLGQDLSSYAQINATAINFLAIETSGTSMLDRIEPSSSILSYLMHKLDGTHRDPGVDGSGSQMPLGPPLPLVERDIIRRWIDQGALNN
ncbi:MAG: Ig-like domain-containing protein [Planctomycetota bacterium]|nr:Ig-like domain-containing protein [Planctomycetota bacterium]